MLVSIVITVETATECLLPRSVGRAHYAAILQRLEAILPGSAATIHNYDGPKPLTCSDILNGHSNRDGTRLAAGKPYYLRVTGLTEAVSQGLLDALVAEPPTRIELDYQPLQVTSSTAQDAQHGWAGTTTYEHLAAHQMLQSSPILKQVTMQFASPTAFKQSGRQMPMPLPDLVFGSLVERWNAFSPVALSPEMRRFGAEMMAISRYRLESRPVLQKNGALRVGGVGTASYLALGGDRYWLATMQMLAEFARYSGVGIQTATGMGQARRLENR